MTVFDVAILVFAVLAGAGGWTAGLLAGVSTVAGFAVGAVTGRFAGPPLAELLMEHGLAEQASAEGLALALPVVAGFVMAGLGGWIGAAMREAIRGRVGRGVDSVGGTLSFLVAFALVVWLGAGFARTTPLLSLNRAVADSAVVSVLDRGMPVTSAEALGAISEALGAGGFPQVFTGQEEQIQAVGEPDPEMVDVGRAAEDRTVRVTTTATTCPDPQAGSGWVLDEGLVVTNAHVVAGSSDRIVQLAGTGAPYPAKVVVFDAQKDIAVLRVDGLDAPPFELGGPLSSGDDSVVVGFPDNGPYTISPSRVRESLQARGLDIYDSESVVRDVYSLRSVVRHGNSGGPLLDDQGRVAGMVFARSAADAETGYALTLAELEEALAEGRQQTEPVGAGNCSGS